MAKIYVSSTFLDLQEHRAQVERVIRRMGHEDVAMEYYVAEDERSVAKCLADVAACDVYVGIFAWRSGTPAKGFDASITELEFREAEKYHKPCLIFLLSDDAPWPRKFIDKDATKIEYLRDTARTNHTADYFITPDELARKVAEAIHKLLPAAVPIPEHNLTTYYDALRKRYGVLALEGLTPPQKEEYLQIQLHSVFVEQNVRENPPPVELPKEMWDKLSRDKEIHPDDLPFGLTLVDVRHARETYYEKPSRPVLDVLTDSRYQRTIILGDPGSGKSTLARYVMLSLIDPTVATLTPDLSRLGNGVLPFLIELRSYAGLCADGNCTTFLEFLEYLGKTEGWALTQLALNNHLKNDGRAVVIFDGLDEIFDPELRERITRQIVGFCGDYPKARVIVTSRVIGYRRKILMDAEFAHFTLQDLDENQVETFVNRWYDLAMSDRPDEAKERRERILKSFNESASIRQLAGNPMLLTIMAIIGKHQELPHERWKLYDHAASVLIQHWDVNKHLKDTHIDADFIGEDDKKELLRRLAFRMQSGDSGLAGNYIHRENLQEEFESYLKERYSKTPDAAKVIAEAMIQQFRERNFILSLYGANLYGFVHRAFLEYFCASAFVYKFEKTKEFDIERLITDVYGKHWADQSWQEVLQLISGMINAKWVEEIIEDLIRSNVGIQTAMSIVFGKHIGNNSLAFQFLLEWSMRARKIEVRTASMWTLALYFIDRPQTIPLLRKLAISDISVTVRNSASLILAEFGCDALSSPLDLFPLRMNHTKEKADYTTLATAQTPALVVFLLDVSASMGQQLKQKTCIEIMTSMVAASLEEMIGRSLRGSRIMPRYRTAILAYGEDVYDVLDGIKTMEQVAALGVPELACLYASTNTANAFSIAERIISSELPNLGKCPAPLACHITDSQNRAIDAIPIAKRMMDLSIPDGNVLIENIVISEQPLNLDVSRILCSMSSVLPESYRLMMEERNFHLAKETLMMFPCTDPEFVANTVQIAAV